MDQNDKQRNSSVPLGTFTEDETAEPATLPFEAVASREEESLPGVRREEESLPGVRVDAQAKQPRQRVKTLMGVPAFESIAPPKPAAISSSSELERDAELLADDVTVDIDLDDPESNEVTMVHDSDVLALPDSPPPSAAERVVDPADQTQPFERPAPEVGLLHRILEAAPPPPVSVAATDDKPSALPLLIPNQYVEARTRERILESAPEERMPEPRDTSSTSQSVSNTAQSVSTPTPTAQPSQAPGAVPTSLAPREVARAPQSRDTDRSSRAGMWMVAAAMLLAAGGWYLTSGSFRRASLTAAPATQPSAATQPMAAKDEETSMQSSSSVPPSLQPPPEQRAPTELPTVAVTGNASGEADGKAPQHLPSATKAHRGKGLSASARSLRAKRGGAKPSSVNEPAGDMPEVPNRGVVVQRLESVRSSVQACASGRSGVADLDITIANNGTVMHVLVGGDFAGTTQGSCIARAVREARFPTFKQDRLRILYPYAI
jgi:hypothetical protein